MGKSERTFYLLLKALKIKKPLASLSRIPGLKAISRQFLGPENADITFIPVNERLEVPPGVTAPISIIERFIDAAGFHVIAHHCMCRKTLGCKDHNIDFGCIFMGDAARDIHPSVARPVSKKEALEHLHMAAEQGLVSSIGKFRLDAFALGLKDHDRLMSICHCCPCCCLYGMVPYAAREFQNMVVPLDGIRIEVTDECRGCGTCAGVCIFKQATLVDGQCVIGADCKRCGRCAMSCPNNAIRVIVEDPGCIDRCVERLRSRVDLTLPYAPGGRLNAASMESVKGECSHEATTGSRDVDRAREKG